MQGELILPEDKKCSKLQLNIIKAADKALGKSKANNTEKPYTTQWFRF